MGSANGSIAEALKILYPGALILLLEMLGLRRNFTPISIVAVESKVGICAAISLVFGVLVYSLVRFLAFEWFLNFFRVEVWNEQWKNEGKSVRISAVELAQYRFSSDSGLTNYLSGQWGWANVQLSTVLVLLAMCARRNEFVLRYGWWTAGIIFLSLAAFWFNVRRLFQIEFLDLEKNWPKAVESEPAPAGDNEPDGGAASLP